MSIFLAILEPSTFAPTFKLGTTHKHTCLGSYVRPDADKAAEKTVVYVKGSQASKLKNIELVFLAVSRGKDIQSAIADSINLSKTMVGNYLKILEQDGRIRRDASRAPHTFTIIKEHSPRQARVTASKRLIAA